MYTPKALIAHKWGGVRLPERDLDSMLRDARIAVVSGAVSAEDALYLEYGDPADSSLRALLDALEGSGAAVKHLDPTCPDFVKYLFDADFAFLNVHGPYGEDGRIQGLLDYLEVPYVNSGVLPSAVGMDKLVTKAVFGFLGIPTPAVVGTEETIDPASLSYPVMIKAAAGGSSVGLDLVASSAEFDGAVRRVRSHGFARWFAENYVEGTPVTVAVLERNGEPVVLPAVETVVGGSSYYDEEAKLTGARVAHRRFHCSERTANLLIDYSIRLFTFLECRGAIRVDYVVDAADGAVWALEINTSPGVQPGGNLPTAAAWAGIAYADLVRHLVAESMARGNRAPWHPVSA